jgi:hypothetical protein
MMNFKDHFRVAHEIAVLLVVVAQGNNVVPWADVPMASIDRDMYPSTLTRTAVSAPRRPVRTVAKY